MMSKAASPAIAQPRIIVFSTIAVITIAVIALILNANVFSDVTDAYKYGRISIPGSSVQRLPDGRIELILENPLGSGTTVPGDLAASIVPLGGGPDVSITRSVGGQFGSSGNRTDTSDQFRRVWYANVPRAGVYRVTVSGGGSDSGLSLDLGHGPPISAAVIWEIAGIVELGLLLLWVVARLAFRGKERESDLA
jgi:hypothetical protein